MHTHVRVPSGAAPDGPLMSQGIRRLHMRTRVVVAAGVVGLVLAVVSWAPVFAAGQTRSREAVKEAAREASFRSETEEAKIWEAELARRKAEVVARAYDPGKPVL